MYKRSYKYIVFTLLFTFCILTFSNTSIYAATFKTRFQKSTVSIKSVKYCEEGIKIKWNKLSGSKGYYIYRKENEGSWEKYDEITKRGYTDIYTETGVEYQYAVVGYSYYNGKIITSKKNEYAKKIVGLPEKIQNVSAKYISKNKAKIKWDINDEVSGYNIYRQIGEGGWEIVADIPNPELGVYNDAITECKMTFKYKVIPYEIVDDVLYEGYFDVTPANAYSDSGIDVSYHNGKIKWSKVKADGVDFAFIRAGRGEPSKKAGAVVDDKFARNVKNARKYDVKVGVYFYSCATSVTQSKKEAKFLVKLLKKYGTFDYPVVYDFESSYRRGRKYIKENTKMIQAFCEIVAEAGYEPMVYSDHEMLTKYVNYDKISKYGIWLAYWTYNPKRYPAKLKNVWIWQYSDKGRYNGIPVYTDKNVRFIN